MANNYGGQLDTVQFVVDQQLRQVQNLQQLQPINGPRVVGVDGSKSPPQVSTIVSPMDGDMPRPAGIGVDFYRKARRIRRDPTIRMIRELSIAPILMAEWEYEADDDCPPEIKQFVEATMSRMRLTLLRTTLCGQCDYGWQPYEIISDVTPEGWVAPRLKPLLQDMTNILVNAADGSFFGLRQTPVIGLRIGWIYLLDRECVVISQDVEGTGWYGEPTLLSLERVYDETEVLLRNSRKYDAKIAGTHWVVKYPLGTSVYGGVEMDNGDIAIAILQKAEAVGGIVLPQSIKQIVDALDAQIASSEAAQWSVDLLSDKGTGQTSLMEKLKYLDVLKVRAFGWPERSVLEGQFGTKAEAGEHADIATSNVEVKHALACEQYNSKIVDPHVIEPNFGPEYRGCVRVKPSPLADDTKEFFEKLYLQIAANPQGFMTESATLDMDQMRDRLGLPAHKMQQLAQAMDPTQQFADDPQNLTYGQPAPDGNPAAPMPLTFDLGASLRDDVERAASKTERPTDAQKDAGNYRKGKVRLHGLTITIETPEGKRRHPDWPKMRAHYGYINRTDGADDAQVDCFVGPDPSSEIAFVVDQAKKSGEFDEHKVMLGFKSQKKALKAYKKSYSGSEYRAAKITPVTISALKEWLSQERISEPFGMSLSGLRGGAPTIVLPEPPRPIKAPKIKIPKPKLEVPKELIEVAASMRSVVKELSRREKEPRSLRRPVINVAPPVVNVAAPDFGPLIEALHKQNDFDLEPERDSATGLMTKVRRVPRKK